MAIQVAKVETWTLVRGPSHYDFVVQGEDVTVRYTNLRRSESYPMPIDEARAFWANLLKQGYERF